MKNKFINTKFIPITLTTSLKTGDWVRVKVKENYEFYKIGVYFDKLNGYELRLNGRDNSTRGATPVASVKNMAKDKWELAID